MGASSGPGEYVHVTTVDLALMLHGLTCTTGCPGTSENKIKELVLVTEAAC